MARRLLFLASLLLAATASATTLDETYNRTFDVRPGARLLLDNVNGRVVVRSWDQPRVRIRAEKHVESRDDAAARKTMADLFHITVDPAGLRVQATAPKNRDGFFDWLAGTSVNAHVVFEITVPRTMNLDLSTVNGAVALRNVSGVLKLSTTNGRIDVDGCGGELEAETTNGSIEAELLQVTAGRPIRLSTTNGRITLHVPRTLAARVDASTSNGAVSSDIPVAATHTERNELRGTVNGGGPAELRLRTTNGSISIRAR